MIKRYDIRPRRRKPAEGEVDGNGHSPAQAPAGAAPSAGQPLNPRRISAGFSDE
jgi:hypothetical protein